MKKTEFKKRNKLTRRFILLNPFINILSVLCVFGIGFGSWSMSGYVEINDTDFGIGDLIDFPSYVEDFNVTTFKVAPNGILNNEIITYDASIKMNFKIKVKNGLFLSYNPLNNILKLDISVENNGTFNFFTTDILLPNPAISYNVNDGVNLFEGVSDININNNTIEFQLDYASQNLANIDYLDYSIQIGMNFDKFKKDFENLIYNQLGDKPISFYFTMGVVS